MCLTPTMLLAINRIGLVRASNLSILSLSMVLLTTLAQLNNRNDLPTE